MQNKKNIKVSAIMPAYNAEKFIREAIESVVRQTYDNIELIVMNDGSTDSTKEIVHSINDERIKYYELDKNHGRGYARNFAISQCTGDVVAICDADDISLPNRFERQLAFLEQHREIAIVGAQLLHFSEKTKPYQVYQFPETPKAIEYSFEKGIMGVAHASCMIRKECFAHLTYEEKIAYSVEDFELFIRFNRFFKMASLSEALVLYRNDLSNITRQKIKQHELYHHYAIYSAHAKLYRSACDSFETWSLIRAGNWKYNHQAVMVYCKVKLKQILRKLKIKLTA